jgi:hypothetical protein
MKTLDKILKEKGIDRSSSAIFNFIKDKKLKVCGVNRNSHNYDNDSTCTFDASNSSIGIGDKCIHNLMRPSGTHGNTIEWRNLMIISMEMNKDALGNQIKEYREAIKDANDNIDRAEKIITMLDELGVESISEEEFEAYNVLLTIQNTEMTDIEQAKAIVALLNK